MTLRQLFNSWPEAKQREFKERFPETTNKELAEIYGLRRDEIVSLAKKLSIRKNKDFVLKCKQQAMKSVRKNGNPFRCERNELPVINHVNLNLYFHSFEEYNSFLEKYPVCNIRELMQEFDLQQNQVNHLHRRLKLKKSKVKTVVTVPEFKSPTIKTAKVDKRFPKSHYQKEAIAKRIEAEKYERINKGNVKSISQAIQEEIAKGKIPYYRDNKTIAFKKVA